MLRKQCMQPATKHVCFCLAVGNLALLAGVGNRAHIGFACVASFTRRFALKAANGSRGYARQL